MTTAKLSATPDGVRETIVIEKQYLRFTRLNRALHIFMIVSFMSLALTGLTLKFSYTGWAVVLSHLLGGFESAGYIHRFAAVIMFGVFIVHITDRPPDEEARRAQLEDDDLQPRFDDVQREGPLGLRSGRSSGSSGRARARSTAAGPTGRSSITSPSSGAWSSSARPGSCSGSRSSSRSSCPGWLLNVATIIHSDEALLAVGFIFTVHFFNTHLRPEKFPMDIVDLHGTDGRRRVRHDKPAEYEELVKIRHARVPPGRAVPADRHPGGPGVRVDRADSRFQHRDLDHLRDAVCVQVRSSLAVFRSYRYIRS